MFGSDIHKLIKACADRCRCSYKLPRLSAAETDGVCESTLCCIGCGRRVKAQNVYLAICEWNKAQRKDSSVSLLVG